MNEREELRLGFETAFIDGNVVSNSYYRPQFVSNNHKEGKKVLSSIESELLNCDKFQISVAFITMSGITPLLQTLKELEERHIPGEVLTTNYLNFSEPKALEKLNGLSNITLKMYDVEAAEEGFHTKGYIFRKGEIYRIIIGSSNITSSALTSNKEWNTKLVSTENGEVTKNIISEFNELWNSKYSLSFDEFYYEYKEKYRIIEHQRRIAKQDEVTSLEKFKLQPNSMQVGFINNLKKIIDAGENRALLISATGTGKTYASAFAMRELDFKRVLFVVHRGQLARQTKKSYEKVFSKTVSMGLVGSGYHDYDSDYVFATVQTLSRDDHLLQYSKDTFDCIILDEAHHVPADTYQKIMNHFEPKLWLGMTATPDKRDDNIAGRNVYELFNHQIAYEIRLQQAMEENLLCPFHYFGLTDLSMVDDESIDCNFSILTSDERVKHILTQANYYGYSGDRIKGLIFCSSIRESEELSNKFNQIINPNTGKNYRTIALNGSASKEERQNAFEKLAMSESDSTNDKQPLDYIFSVEILNEGVDIVEVNQVIMLRPTQSPIVFIQQLGRGLRKAEGKDYVVILDFIGNYNNNFMIPIALSGDRTYNKDNVRRYLMEGGRIIPGESTVHFDEISRSRIYASIDRMSTTIKMLTEKYNTFKERLGKIPSIMDFYLNGEIDPMLFVEHSKSYDQFVRRVDKDYKVVFTDYEEAILEFVSNIIMNGKRIHELLMLKKLVEDGEFSADGIRKSLIDLGENYRDVDYVSAYNVISKEFINSPSEKKRYSDIEFIDKTKAIKSQAMRVASFYERLRNLEFQKELQTLIEYGIRRYKDMYSDHDENNLVLYQKYSRKDVCRILNWAKDDSSTVYGYRIKHDTCPIFVTYEKADDIASSTKYLDEFERVSCEPDVYSNKIFSWMTRSKVSENSTEAQQIIHAKESGLKILLFLKKSDGEGSDFYYMGEATPINWQQTTIYNDKNEELPIMNFKLELKKEVRKDIFDYFTA
ncbi:MAG: DEAD/DEAH box helicase [Lachnospiraceae bacterium]|nr:DEAD/DEAH box helicase [Lachnospiraceae bacterium]